LNVVIALAALAAIIAGWFVLFGESPQSAPPARTPLTAMREQAPTPAPAASELPAAQAAFSTNALASQTPPPVRAATAQEILAEFGRASDPESRAEVARNLASLDTVESIEMLARLFATARAYPDRVSIVGALSDSQSDITVEARLAILRSALAPGQVRQVRSVALDVAAQIEDPRAVDILRQAAKNDPDSQIRELAKAALSVE
jgi:HEAT repeat protein